MPPRPTSRKISKRPTCRVTSAPQTPPPLAKNPEAPPLPRHARHSNPQPCCDGAQSTARPRPGLRPAGRDAQLDSTLVWPGLATMIVPGGTPSVTPLRVASSTGRPAAVTRVDAEPGSVEMTVVQGFVPGLGGCAHPTMGAPARSPSRSTGL